MTYAASRVAPACLELIEPAVVGFEASPEDAGNAGAGYSEASPSDLSGEAVSSDPGPSEACRRLADSAAEVYSRWFLAMRGAIGRERERRARYREENGLAKSAKVPRLPPAPTEGELATAQACEGVARAMFGDLAADYARERFRCAMATGDMRAFKIRLLLLKARDSLAGSPLRAEFVSLLDECISTTESKAGCVACPGPRRLSHAEREKKRLREEAARMKEATSLDVDTPEVPGSVEDATSNDEDAGPAGGTPPTCEHPRIDDFLEQELSGFSDVNQNFPDKDGIRENEGLDFSVTVTDAHGAPKKRVQPKNRDVLVTEAGKKYKTADDVVKAMKKGEISPGKALMLMASVESGPRPSKSAGGRRSSWMRDCDLASLADEIEAKEFGVEEDEYGGGDPEPHRDEDAEEEDDGGELVDDNYRYDSKAGVGGTAYNTGRYRYSSCYGGYNASGAEWCPDDDF